MNNEPVGWMSNEKEFYVQKNYCPDFIPLYTHPAKTLTDGEIDNYYKSTYSTYAQYEGFVEGVKWALEKAQEK